MRIARDDKCRSLGAHRYPTGLRTEQRRLRRQWNPERPRITCGFRPVREPYLTPTRRPCAGSRANGPSEPPTCADVRRVHAGAGGRPPRAEGGSSNSRDQPNADAAARYDGQSRRRPLFARSLKSTNGKPDLQDRIAHGLCGVFSRLMGRG
jgi:hypothetical protein